MNTAREHLEAQLPRLTTAARADQRRNIVAALHQARQHINNIRHNPKAAELQEQIIARYESQLAALDNQDWLDK